MFGKKIIKASCGIEVMKSSIHDRGVFATDSFEPGDTIEKAPVILLQQPEREILQTTSLFGYYFLIGDGRSAVALGLGYCSLYNHSGRANAVYTISLKTRSITIKAYKKINPGEEICLNYNGRPDDDAPVYFPPS